MKRIPLLLSAASLLLASSAFAHEAKGPNGGRIVDAGNYHAELVISGSQVDLFLSDTDEKAVAPLGFKALAILNASGKVQRVALDPADKVKLSGKAEMSLPSDAKGVVQLTLPDGKTAQGQFK